ncbi:hypothetical protein B566_EDAN000705 [Ephemera danica]|nr:hypothetical protein B566_EDAN000705 [Ephemera danica]
MALGVELRGVLVNVLAREGLQLERHEVTEECRPGDDYLGDVLRVSTTFSSHNPPKHFIFKRPPHKDDARLLKFFRNEATFYQDLLPKLEEFKTQFDSAPAFAIPRRYHIASDVIVLEDLMPLGFRMSTRTTFLDLHHCVLVLEEMGRFHAVSLAMKTLQPDKISLFRNTVQETVFCKAEEKYAKTEEACENALLMLMRRYPESEYVDVLKEFTRNFFVNMTKLVSSDSRLRVINHGNCWANNLMFQYDELQGRPVHVRWFDFQLSRYASAACDLSYFIYNCTTQTTRDEQWEELMTAYLAEFNETLALVHLPLSQISRGQLDEEMANFAAFGVGMAILLQQPLAVNNGHDVEFESASAIRITDIVVDAVTRGFLEFY